MEKYGKGKGGSGDACDTVDSGHRYSYCFKCNDYALNASAYNICMTWWVGDEGVTGELEGKRE